MKGKVKTIAFILVFALLFNIFAPTMSVIATSYGEGGNGIQIGIDSNPANFEIQSITVDGNSWTSEQDKFYSTDADHNYIVVIKVKDNDNQYPDIMWGGNWNGDDGTITKDSTNADGIYTYTLTTKLSSEGFKRVSLNINSINKQTSTEKAEIEFNSATSITGNATQMKVNYDNGYIAVTGANMTTDVNTNNKLYISTTSAGNMTFEAVANENYTGKILENGNEKVNPYTLNVQLNSHYNIDAEFTPGGSPSTNATANITVSAGDGSYMLRGNNVNYDDEVEISINGSRWNHSNTIQYNADNSDTTVKFTFETLWINRFYDNITINGVSYNVSDYLDFDDRTEWLKANHGTQALAFDIPNVAKADSYNVVVKHGENNGSKYLATFLWTADPAQANGHNYIGNAKLEFVKATYSVGNTTYTVTEKDLEGKLQRDGGFLSADSEDGFLNYGVTADVNYDDGSLTLPGGAEVTMRVVPDYGYQVTSVNGGDDFKTTNSGVSEFTVTVEEGTAGYFQATVEKVDNTVTPTSEKVKAGNIVLGDNAATDIKNGTVRLSVEDVELTSDKITNFEEKASEAGDYTITNYLDINLDKVLYKGTADDVWSEQIHHLTDKALITLQLEEGVDASNIVIVHNIDNGDEFEIIPIESYDAETNTISFYTNSFSNYAIANKISSTTENTKTTDTSSNPTTGDNIIMIISIFAIATFGVFTTLKVNKNRRIRKH